MTVGGACPERREILRSVARVASGDLRRPQNDRKRRAQNDRKRGAQNDMDVSEIVSPLGCSQ